MPKPVALILLNWNTPVHTANCILSINKYCDDQYFDIIVVDNGSTDDSVAVLKTKFPNLLYIENKENLGFAEGNNRGLIYSIESGYTYSLVMNTDTLVNEDLVMCLMTHLEMHPQAAAVQPAIYWMHNPTKIWNGEGSFNPVLGVTRSDTSTPKKNDTKSYKIAEWVTGCCMLLRNSVLKTAGLFNQHFFLYYEDVELSFRLRSSGYELHYLPSCKMYHEAGVSAKVEKNEGYLSPVIHYYTSRNHIWFLRKYGKPIFYPINIVYNGAYYLALLTYFKLRGRNEKAAFLIKGLKQGIRTPQTAI
jgi:GT2 family glycosyltransferase